MFLSSCVAMSSLYHPEITCEHEIKANVVKDSGEVHSPSFRHKSVESEGGKGVRIPVNRECVNVVNTEEARA